MCDYSNDQLIRSQKFNELCSDGLIINCNYLLNIDKISGRINNIRSMWPTSKRVVKRIGDIIQIYWHCKLKIFSKFQSKCLTISQCCWLIYVAELTDFPIVRMCLKNINKEYVILIFKSFIKTIEIIDISQYWRSST